MGMRDAGVTDAQTRQYNLDTTGGLLGDGHGREKLFSWAILLCR